MFLLRNSLCNVPVEHLSNILWVRGTICAWHTPWSVLFGVTRMFTCSFTPQATSMSNASVLSAAASVGCVSRSRPEHTRYYTHTLLACVFVNWTGSHVWNCHGGGRVGGCGVRMWCLRCTSTGQMRTCWWGYLGKVPFNVWDYFFIFFFINSSEGMSESLISWRRARLMKLLLRYLQSIKTWLKNSIKMGKAMKNQRWCLQRSKINAVPLSCRHHHEPPEY